MGIERISQFWPEWKIEGELGEGAFGKVYRAVREDHSLKSYAAIKVISIPQSKAEISALIAEGMSVDETKGYFEGIVKDFLNEIKLMEAVKGTTNIVSVEDYRIIDSPEGMGWDIFIRMELLTSFAEHVQKNPMTEGDVVKLGIDICSALEVCYKNNIIHRDIKPANIFVSKLGDYKIGDFGVAKELEKTAGAVSAKGTFSYMAPEVAMGKKYDASVDIYSLGLVMYGLLNNNRHPFIDPKISVVSYNDRKAANERRISGENLPAPCNASPELASIILSACAFEPECRFSNPTALKNALISYQSGSSKTNEKARSELDATVSVRLPERESSEDEAVTVSETKVNKKPGINKKKGRGVFVFLIVLLLIAAAAVGTVFLLKGRDDVGSASRTDDTETAEPTDSVETKGTDETVSGTVAVKPEPEVIPAFKLGDEITLGTYEQDNDLTNGDEPIEWIVIDAEDDKVLVISKYGLDAIEFLDREKRSLPVVEWLENFDETAFNYGEKKRLIANDTECKVSYLFDFSWDSSTGTGVGVARDNCTYSFPLSVEEADYCLTDEQKICEATPYAKANGAAVNPYCWWWLRDDVGAESVTNVNGNGEIVTEPGTNALNSTACVRPAMWITVGE